MQDHCPCQSGNSYADCCEGYHRGDVAVSAEKLMRSRYCAFAKGEVEYLIATTHPNSPSYNADHAQWRTQLEAHCASTQFLDLKILATSDPSPTEATVTFNAKLQRAGQDVSFEEQSQFEKVDGRWLYIEPSDLEIEKPW